LPPKLFQGVRFSTEHTLADSLASLGGQSHAVVAELADVDTAADLASARSR